MSFMRTNDRGDWPIRGSAMWHSWTMNLCRIPPHNPLIPPPRILVARPGIDALLDLPYDQRAWVTLATGISNLVIQRKLQSEHWLDSFFLSPPKTLLRILPGNPFCRVGLSVVGTSAVPRKTPMVPENLEGRRRTGSAANRLLCHLSSG